MIRYDGVIWATLCMILELEVERSHNEHEHVTEQ